MNGAVLLRVNRVRGQSATFHEVMGRVAGRDEGVVRSSDVLLALVATPACGAARGLHTLGPPVDLLADLVRGVAGPSGAPPSAAGPLSPSPSSSPSPAAAAGPVREIRLVRGSRRRGAPVPRSVVRLRADESLFHGINLAWLYGHRWGSRRLGTPNLLVGMAQHPTSEVYRAVRLWGLDIDDLTARIRDQVERGALDED